MIFEVTYFIFLIYAVDLSIRKNAKSYENDRNKKYEIYNFKNACINITSIKQNKIKLRNM